MGHISIDSLRPPRYTLFPYTTLFRSRLQRARPGPAGGSAAVWTEGLSAKPPCGNVDEVATRDRKSTRLNSSHLGISYAVFCLKKKKRHNTTSKKHQCTTYPM